MDASLIDSSIFGHNWATSESRELFGESARLTRWLHVIQALAATQAEFGLIPQSSSQAIAELDGADLDQELIAERTRITSHSTLGLIQVLQEALPNAAREHVYYGATVQDITDTAATLELIAVGRAAWRDMWDLERKLLVMAKAHRTTVMLGRTHGQPGAPISFGYKVASWADEVGRSLERLRDGHRRWNVGQLAGAVGSMGFYGDEAFEVRNRFCEHLGLQAATISWTNSRDRLAEYATTAAILASSLERIANEIYNLQREEIGELTEGSKETTVGSITMPHKVNPENSEQVVVLARLVRTCAAAMVESMAGEHERDGSSWKAEWLLLPQLSHHLLASIAMTNELIAGLVVNQDRMLANIKRFGFADSQELLRRVSARIGKHRAQDQLGRQYRRASETGIPLHELLAEVATEEELEGLDKPNFGSAAKMVDAVVRSAEHRRATESSTWMT